TAEELRQLGERYVASLRERAPGARFITDKRPLNFLYIGLILMALPNARIIHTRRDPVETCLSCFSHLFNGHYPFAYDLAELGRYWKAYDRLM
ncbi:sulfotransferase, partial [Acinetobacter baumannii]